MRRLLILTLVLVAIVVVAFEPFNPKFLVAVYHDVRYSSDEKLLPEGKYFEGTGAFIAPNLVLTAGHILPIPDWDESPQWQEVKRRSVIKVAIKVGGQFYLTKPIIFQKEADIAVLKVYGYRSKDFLPVSFELPQVGDSIKVISWFSIETEDEGEPIIQPTFWFLTVSNPKFRHLWGIGEPIEEEMILGRPAAWHGSSGSPALKDGKVIGVIVGILENGFTLVEPIAKIKQQLQKLLRE
jgi:hypothetical protein